MPKGDLWLTCRNCFVTSNSLSRVDQKILRLSVRNTSINRTQTQRRLRDLGIFVVERFARRNTQVIPRRGLVTEEGRIDDPASKSAARLRVR